MRQTACRVGVVKGKADHKVLIALHSRHRGHQGSLPLIQRDDPALYTGRWTDRDAIPVGKQAVCCHANTMG